MSLVYIAPYRQKDSWGIVSRGLAKTIAKQDNIDLVIRPVWYNINSRETDIGELEQYELAKIKEKDALIQFGLPSYLNYNGDFQKNIAVTMVDCRIDNLSWVYHLNLFDEIIVFSEYEKIMLEQSGVKVKISNLICPPIELDTSLTEFEHHFKDSYTFYTTASADQKSGLKETIIAFLSSFTVLDNNILAILCDDSESESIQKEIEHIKTLLGIFKNHNNYPNIAVINNQEQGIVNYAHSIFDCYISVPYNSTIDRQVIHAFSNNTPCILLDTCKSQIHPPSWPHQAVDYPLLVRGTEEVSLYNHRPIPYMYSGEQNWIKPTIVDIKDKMKAACGDAQVMDMAKEKIYKFNSIYINSNNQQIKEILCM